MSGRKMQKLPMRKLLLVPTVVVTAFLALAFLMPATAASVVKSVAPMVHLSLNSVLMASSANEAVAPAASTLSGRLSSSRASSSLSGSSPTLEDSTSQTSVNRGNSGNHDVSTAGKTNCGRFGNGHHGGKHDFICPNRPFPAPVSF